jgi:LacI family transcriptional regulator
MKRALVALMRANEWQVLDLHFHGGGLPPGPPPHGVFVSDVWSHPRVQELHRVGCHLIRLGYVPSLWDDLLPAVVEDHAAAGRLAAEHFVGRRFRHVGFVGYGQMTLFKSMADPFRDHAQKLGAEFHLMLFPKLTKRQDRLPTAEKRRVRIHQLVQWFREAPTPIGMLAWSDNHGGRISVAAREAGLDIPSEVAVLGHGNEAWKCESAPVPLSSIDLGIVQQAEIAVGLMEQQLAGAPLPREAVVLPPAGIVVRQSSDALAVGDPVVARALRFMWDHLEQDLGTDDVADAVGINRRKLERMFHSHLGRSVRSVLRRRRLEQLKLLLRSTDLPIVDLAPQVGFRSAQYLSNAFRQDVGMSPRDYRQSHDRKIGA